MEKLAKNQKLMDKIFKRCYVHQDYHWGCRTIKFKVNYNVVADALWPFTRLGFRLRKHPKNNKLYQVYYRWANGNNKRACGGTTANMPRVLCEGTLREIYFWLQGLGALFVDLMALDQDIKKTWIERG